MLNIEHIFYVLILLPVARVNFELFVVAFVDVVAAAFFSFSFSLFGTLLRVARTFFISRLQFSLHLTLSNELKYEYYVWAISHFI